jgi:MFS family permease
VSVLAAYRRLLHNGPLVRLLGGEFVSSIGDWLYLVALLVLVYQASSDPVLLGIVGAARVLPYVLLSIPAGIVADRFDRRLVLLVTDVARGVIMLALAGLQAVHGPLAAIVGLAILATCFSTFFGPTIGSYLPSLVADERELGPANSAWSSLDNLAFVIGPAVAGLLIAIGGLTAAFLLNAASFGVIAIVLWRLPAAAERVTPTEPAGAAPAETVEVPLISGPPTPIDAGMVPARLPFRPLAGLAVLDVASGFAIGGIGILTVVLATRQLNAGEDGTGYLNAAIGVGGLLGAVGSGLVVVRSRLSLPLVAGVVVFALGLAGLGLSSSLGTGFVMLAVASAGSLLVEVVSTTLLQRIIPPQARGRAIGSIQTVGTLAYASGSFALPILADRLGVAPVLGATAVLVVAAGILGTALVGGAGAEAGDPELAAVARRVAGLPLFAGIPPFRVASTLARGTTVEVRAGDPIIRQGEPADRFYVILDGTVEVSRSEASGEPARRIRSLGPDDAFGELGLLTGAARSATVTAETPVRLLALDAAVFLELVTAGPELAPRLLVLHRGAAVAPTSASPATGA